MVSDDIPRAMRNHATRRAQTSARARAQVERHARKLTLRAERRVAPAALPKRARLAQNSRVPKPPPIDIERAQFAELARLLEKAQRQGVASFSAEELDLFPNLYRYAASRLAYHETRGRNAASLVRLREMLARSHELLYRDIDRSREPLVRRIARFYASDVPRTIRAEWKLIAGSFALVYGLALISYFAVIHDLEIAYALLDPATVADEIRKLQATAQGEPFRGNFTFGLNESPILSGFIMTHNMWVAVLFFASGLLPPLLFILLAVNGLMLGTYTAVAAHWEQAGNISSILWCHGVLEIQAFVLAGAASLVLVRAWIAPGPWSRKYAMSLEGKRAWRLLAPVFPMLFLAGMIEAWVSPHAPIEARIATAIASAIGILVWITLGGRGVAL
jgi:uncharacterized membrane protein SpoIIM required for sporulation